MKRMSVLFGISVVVEVGDNESQEAIVLKAADKINTEVMDVFTEDFISMRELKQQK